MHAHEQDTSIEIRLVGENLSPYTVSARDASRVISAVEQMLKALVSRDQAARPLPKSGIVVGLAAIEQGSYILRFTTPYPDVVMPAYQRLGAAIQQADFANLPAKSVEGLREVSTVARKYHAQAEFWQSDGHRTHLGTVTPNMRIRPRQLPHVEEYTTLYGTVLRVGGDRPPRARIRFLSGQALQCRITQRDDLRIARALGQRLYETVGLRGQVRWDAKSGEIVDFRIDEVTDYQSGSSTAMLAALRQRVGEHYRTVGNIEHFVAEMRGRAEASE